MEHHVKAHKKTSLMGVQNATCSTFTTVIGTCSWDRVNGSQHLFYGNCAAVPGVCLLVYALHGHSRWTKHVQQSTTKDAQLSVDNHKDTSESFHGAHLRFKNPHPVVE